VVLEEERDRIVCWALRQTPDLIRRGHFVQPKESIDEVTAWRTGQDEISLFLHDRTVPCEAIRGQGTDADSLYQAYYAWAPVNGYKVRNKNNFLAAVDKRRKKFYDNAIQRRMYPVTLKSA
jgi:phage/plasmid-associated DNA primase